MAYADDELLMLSGIQHFMFCPRQWALIHVEQLWQDNRLTVEGNLLHTRVDDPLGRAGRMVDDDCVSLHSVKLVSYELGLYGIGDVVEFHNVESSQNAIKLPGHDGWWQPLPIEYKRGRPKLDECDKVQLAAQVICLEEMYGLRVCNGAFFYGETRHRCIVSVNDELRNLTKECARRMHEFYDACITPPPQPKKHCRSCSLMDWCMPELAHVQTVDGYLQKMFHNEKTAEYTLRDNT